MMMNNYWIRTALACLCAAPLAVLAAAPAELDDTGLLQALREGGLVILMRHASSPRGEPEESIRHEDNVDGERQLDAQGRADAVAMGAALEQLGIVVGEVDTSPTFRAQETAQLMGFDIFTTYPELGNEGMLAANSDQAEWLLSEVTREIESGNRLIITHAPNIGAAFPGAGRMDDGEALIVDPQDSAHPAVVGRVAISDWSTLGQ